MFWKCSFQEVTGGFSEVRILKKLAKNDLETKTEREASEASMRYYLSTIIARIIGLSMPGLSGVWHLTQGVVCLQLDMAAFQIGTEGLGRCDGARARSYNRRAQ